MSGLDLSGERKTKQAFEPWLKAGGWTIQDLTQSKTEKYNFPQILETAKKLGASQAVIDYYRGVLYGYADSIELPHDGEATRCKVAIWYDYKYKETIKLGMGINKDDYDKYADYKKPWFYLFIYVGDTKRRYIHQIQNPKKSGYDLVQYRGINHYLIPPKDYWAPIEPTVPVVLPTFDGLSVRESIAMLYALDDWACNDFVGDFKGLTDAHLESADKFLQLRNGGFPRLRFRKLKPPKNPENQEASKT